jgi:hypothetical protein
MNIDHFSRVGADWKRYKNILVLLFWLTFTATIYFALRPVPAGSEFGVDKYNHMLAFAILTLLAILAYGYHRIWQMAERLSVFGMAIELVQSTSLIGRDCDFMDWVADSASIVVVVGFALMFRKLARPNRTSCP